MTCTRFRFQDQYPGLLRGTKELHQIWKRNLFQAAAHARCLGGRRTAATQRDAPIRHQVGAAARRRFVGDGHQLENAGSNQDAVTLLQGGVLNLLPVDEGAVGRPHVLDRDDPALQADAGVTPRDHLFDENHIQVARAADDNFLELIQRKLTALVLPRDEPQR